MVLIKMVLIMLLAVVEIVTKTTTKNIMTIKFI